MVELKDKQTKLKNAEYRLSENKSEVLRTEIEWIGHIIDQSDIRLLQNQQLALKELKIRKARKN